jgi:hypothetical protein
MMVIVERGERIEMARLGQKKVMEMIIRRLFGARPR